MPLVSQIVSKMIHLPAEPKASISLGRIRKPHAANSKSRPLAVTMVTQAVSISSSLPISGVDQAAATAMDADRLFTEYPPRHIKVVDHHVSKESA